MARDKGNKVFREVMKGTRDRTPTPAERRASAESERRVKAERERLGRIAAADRAKQLKDDQQAAEYAQRERDRRQAK